MRIQATRALFQAAREKNDEQSLFRVLLGEPIPNDGPTRAALLRQLALELELTASHMRRVLEESRF